MLLAWPIVYAVSVFLLAFKLFSMCLCELRLHSYRDCKDSVGLLNSEVNSLKDLAGVNSLFCQLLLLHLLLFFSSL